MIGCLDAVNMSLQEYMDSSGLSQKISETREEKRLQHARILNRRFINRNNRYFRRNNRLYGSVKPEGGKQHCAEIFAVPKKEFPISNNEEQSVFNKNRDRLTKQNVHDFAKNFLKYLEEFESMVHAPKYNLEIQGKIATLQKKVMSVTNTGIIIPEAGTGFNFQIKPHSSSTSMMIRHA